MNNLATNDYVPGHTSHELERLVSQGAFFGDLTEQVLRAAGLAPGMHVLDVGSGAGDVSFLAASLVGPHGSVVGIDRSMEAVAYATQRARDAGVTNVRFEVRDVNQPGLARRFDAVVGRLVLMYFPNPADVLRRLTRLVVPGGIVAFHEIDCGYTLAEPHVPLYAECISRIVETLARSNANPRMGMKLIQTFRHAGLPEPATMVHTRLGGAGDPAIFEQIAAITRTLAPAMEKLGIATIEELELGTLAARLRQAVWEGDATIGAPLFVGAWAHNIVI
jgi:2-polyprenyl-3-methyl-5-hydroxy-6-metoxy-1,4-benzoquinol methylase